MASIRQKWHRWCGFELACVGFMALFVCACQGPATDTDEAAAAAGQPRQIKVITSGGFTNAFDILAPIFEQATGIEVITAYGSSMGGGPDSIPVRLDRGEAADLLILNDSALELLNGAGHVRADTRVVLGRALIAMAVRSGATLPDISTTEAFVDTLLAAESIGYSASVSGTYLSSEVFPRLGIWQAIEQKTQRIVSERVASVVARGEVEVGFQPVSELMGVDGAEVVGPIPDELQQASTFVAVIAADAENPEDAAKLAEFLSSEAVAGIVESTGLSPDSGEATAMSDPKTVAGVVARGEN